MGPGIRQESSWAAVGDQPWRQCCGEEKQRTTDTKDQEKRMYRVVESQSCDTSKRTSKQAHTQVRTRGMRAGGGMEDKRDWMENRN